MKAIRKAEPASPAKSVNPHSQGGCRLMIPEVDRRHDSERPSYGIRKAIEAIKGKVRIERLAAEYTEVKLLGNGRLLCRCVASDHEDRTPSMTVYTDSQKFRCYGCGIGGDLMAFSHVAMSLGIDRDAASAIFASANCRVNDHRPALDKE